MSQEITRFKESKDQLFQPVKFEEPRGVFVSTYGCQMNVNDSDRMISLLEMLNYTPVQQPKDAALIIINSCSVREKPVHKVHSEVGRYRKLKLTKPDLLVGVAGCVAQQEKDQLLKDLPAIDFVLGPDNIDSLPEIVSKLHKAPEERLSAARFKHQEAYHVQTLVQNPGVSTFVNITKGCDNFCTFCVVPYTRGRERSRPYKQLVEDINKLTSRGVKEVTLLGQNVNSYTSDCGVNFANLLKGLCEDTDIKRIRYSTSHPKDFTEELIKISADYRDKICEFIHLPVQSGNTEILAKMNRGYSREDYLEKVDKIFDYLPGASLSTDIIVGFPGETEQQFNDTLSLIDRVPYESIYAFKYSPRPFTKAAKWEDHLSEEEKSDRLHRLFEKHKIIAHKLCEKYDDQEFEVLVEKRDEDRGNWSGRTTHNKVVNFVGGENLVGKFVKVKILKAFPLTLRGEFVSEY